METEAPLLDELGVDVGKVLRKLKTIVLLRPPAEDFLEEPDLAGPLLLTTLLGFLLLLVS